MVGTPMDLLGTTFLMFALDGDALGRAGDRGESRVASCIIKTRRAFLLQGCV